MQIKMALVVFILASVLVSLPLLLAGAARADDQSAKQDEILNKLDQILSNQKAIMDQMESLKQELNIVKIRVTQQQ